MTAAERKDMLDARHAIDAQYPEVRAGFEDVMANLLHALKVAGVDHVGIGLDWDGGGGVTVAEEAVGGGDGLDEGTERVYGCGRRNPTPRGLCPDRVGDHQGADQHRDQREATHPMGSSTARRWARWASRDI